MAINWSLPRYLCGNKRFQSHPGFFTLQKCCLYAVVTQLLASSNSNELHIGLAMVKLFYPLVKAWQFLKSVTWRIRQIARMIGGKGQEPQCENWFVPQQRLACGDWLDHLVKPLFHGERIFSQRANLCRILILPSSKLTWKLKIPIVDRYTTTESILLWFSWFLQPARHTAYLSCVDR